jgi:hypothetical protein
MDATTAYAWSEKSLDNLAVPDAGDVLRRLVGGEQREEKCVGRRLSAREQVLARSTCRNGQRGSYALSALEGEVRRVLTAPHGTRNNTLHEAALKLGTLVGCGALDAVTVVQVLHDAALRRGLTPKEAEGTIASGLKYGIAHPREMK